MGAAVDAAVMKMQELGAHVTEVKTVPLSQFQACNRIIMGSESYAIHQKWLRERPQDRQALAMLAVGVVSIACAPVLVGFFTDDPAVLTQGVSCLRIVAVGYGFYAVGMIVTQAFNGAGDTATPTLVNLVGFWLLQIPLAWALAAPLGFGPRGVFLAVLCAETFIALLAAGLFRRGRWKLKGV